MKKNLFFVISIVAMFGCSEYDVQEFSVDYDTILSDSINKELLMNKDGFVQFAIQNGGNKCKKAFNLVYSIEEQHDTTWYVISTQCIFGDTIIDGVRFDQEEDILDRIYYNAEKTNPEYISIDLLEKITWEHGVYYSVNMLEVDCQGQFIHMRTTSEDDREMRRLTKNKKYCGTYLSDVVYYKSRLELRDGTIEGSYAMKFQLRDSEGCINIYSQLDKIIKNDVLDLIPDTITIKLSEDLAVLTVEKLIICDTIANLKLNLEKSKQ